MRAAGWAGGARDMGTLSVDGGGCGATRQGRTWTTRQGRTSATR